MQKNKTKNSNLLNNLIDDYFRTLFNNNDLNLIKLFFTNDLTQQKLDNFLEGWDIETEGGHKGLILAYFMKEHSDLEFSDYVRPRLKGLLDYFRFDNIKKLRHFSRVGKALNLDNIPVLLFKGGAMKYLRPEFSRPMGDTDVLVPWGDFSKTCNICKDMGYSFRRKQGQHSIDLCYGDEESILDIHRYIYMDSECCKELNKGLFKRAREVKAFGVNVLIPTHEDMFFLVLQNFVKNIKDKTSMHGLLFALIDCEFLIKDKDNFDWNIVLENAKLTKTQAQIKLAVDFINVLVPNLLPESLSREFCEREFLDYYNKIIFNNLYYFNTREISRSLKFKNIMKNPLLYIKVKPKYLFIKSIKDNPNLVSLFLKINNEKGNKIAS